jgi:hypothetical protein
MRYLLVVGLVVLQWINGRIIGAMSQLHMLNNRIINKGLAILEEE